jgi:adenine-specific DNA-methyltransferase
MYNFYWYGKESAIKESYGFTNSVLVEDKESSRNWDATENLYIEGDNLEVLKLLQKSYFGKVKMIYIDPPYNTGKDFVYKDNFRDSISNYKEITNQTTRANPETNGRYHTDWLNMMYPRLKLARNLLTDDGVIFISIDDNEVNNLKKICDEILGEQNFIGNIIWQKSNGKNDSKTLRVVHEYILTYSKCEAIEFRNIELDKEYISTNYKNPDNDLRGPWMSLQLYKEKNPYSYTVISPTGKEWTKPWNYNKNGFSELENKKLVYWGKDGNSCPRKKIFLKDSEGVKSKSIWTELEVGGNQHATNEQKTIFNTKIFDFTKPSSLIERLIKISNIKNNDIILDFFSGSATTAHATMNANIEYNSNCKYIMVQLPEQTEEKSEAYKKGYKNICEIGKERIRRAGDKIVSENKDKEGIENLDIGFKVFKLKEGNMFQKLQKEILNGDSIKIEIIKRPKIKGLEKIKIDNETYYLFEDETYYKVFNYSKGQNEVIASIFSKEECKNVSYMELERVYTDVLVDFNKGWYHSNYVTVRILDEIYKKLQH